MSRVFNHLSTTRRQITRLEVTHKPAYPHHITISKMSSNAPNPDIIEAAKKKAAYRAVADHFNTSMRHVGIGSGSTIKYGVEAIRDHLSHASTDQQHEIYFTPTGSQSRKMIEDAGLNVLLYDAFPADVTLDVAFDGADEVDGERNCIKGGGACLFQEKLVATRAKRFVCIADYRKHQTRLLNKWPSIPIEVAPIAAQTVVKELKRLGAINPEIRHKDGENVRTDQGFWLVDAPFKPLLTSQDVQAGRRGDGHDGNWEVESLATRIKSITGVLEVGLFVGRDGVDAESQGQVGGQKPIAIYFGTEDGQVTVQTK